MKLLLLVFTGILLSCNQQKPTKQPEVPKALENQNSSGYELISKSRSYSNLIQDIYNEILKTNKELNQLETAFDAIDQNAVDSLKTFNEYADKNNRFYIAAKEYASSISDSSLKKQIEELVNTSETVLKNRIRSHEQLVKKKEDLAKQLKNLHSALMLVVTLPVMEKYQKEFLPSVKPLTELNSQYLTLIQKTDTLIKKQ